jgi:hypothetical protein
MRVAVQRQCLIVVVVGELAFEGLTLTQYWALITVG